MRARSVTDSAPRDAIIIIVSPVAEGVSGSPGRRQGDPEAGGRGAEQDGRGGVEETLQR